MIFLIFVDGLGLGEKDPEKNPCAGKGIRHLAHFDPENASDISINVPVLIPTDAALGVDGLPQSATGQATLLSGINCAKVLGRHLQGFPNQQLRDLLKEQSLLREIRGRGFRPVFINAYRPPFFSLPEEIQWKLSVTTIVTLAAGLPFFGLEDLREERSIYHDLTNASLIRRGFEVPLFSVEKAAKILADASENYDFILYEYFMTDKAGHSQDMAWAYGEILKLERFIDTLLSLVDLNKNTVILTSDHGNVEDLSVKTHTRNRVMTLVWGQGHDQLRHHIQSITDIAPAVLRILETYESNRHQKANPAV
ncbi:MAG: alkaline phosphatase family protein [Syntrophaceae bacterium]|nr:alkaline phosphatase family protein [Syntrophaceae bacterium]